jgi:dihydrofolate reductase
VNVSIIAAIAEGNRAIGLRGRLPWHLPADLAHFRQLTMGHAVIMGRLTWEPLADRGLPGRRMIILTRDPAAGAWGAEVRTAASFHEAVELAAQDLGETEVFVAGGEQVFEMALASGLVDRMYLTWIEIQVEADSFFPEFDPQDWITRTIERRPSDQANPHPMSFHRLERADPRG